ncbi:hypothetical protein JCM10212_004302 [Sporobolomyces blumeae]
MPVFGAVGGARLAPASRREGAGANRGWISLGRRTKDAATEPTGTGTIDEVQRTLGRPDGSATCGVKGRDAAHLTGLGITVRGRDERERVPVEPAPTTTVHGIVTDGKSRAESSDGPDVPRRLGSPPPQSPARSMPPIVAISVTGDASPSPLVADSTSLRQKPSLSTLSSGLTTASTTTVTLVDTPTLDTAPTLRTNDVCPEVVVPRPNAQALRRVRSFARPVSVFFSPDRPPALPLPSLPASSPGPPSPSCLAPPSSAPSSPTVTLTPSPPCSLPSSPPPLRRPVSVNGRLVTPYGFYTPSYGRVPRRPPSKAPDRPLPALPGCANDRALGVALAFKGEAPARSSSLEALGTRTESGTPPSTPRVPCTSLPPSPRHGVEERPEIPFFGYTLNPEATVVMNAADARRRVDSASSVASLDVGQISKSLDLLATVGPTQQIDPVTPRAATISIPNSTSPFPTTPNPTAIDLTQREKDRERVRRLISRVSSVIEMRKMSVASTATGSSTTTSGGVERERGGYKAYKLERKPSLSPSLSFTGPARPRRARSSSVDSSDSSASEELFDLSFDSSHLSPSSPSTSSLREFGSSWSGSVSSHASSSTTGYPSTTMNRYSAWSNRRRSSATTLGSDDAEDRLKVTAMRRADELFGPCRLDHGGEGFDGHDGGGIENDEAEELRDGVGDDLVQRPYGRELRARTSLSEMSSSITRRPEGTAGIVSERVLHPVRSVPTLRRPTRSTSPRSPQLTERYAFDVDKVATLTATEAGTGSTLSTANEIKGLKPLITSNTPRTRSAASPSASPVSARLSRIPDLSSPGLVPRTTRNPSEATSSQSIGSRAPASTSAIPHRRQPSLSTLSYHHTSSPIAHGPTSPRSSHALTDRTTILPASSPGSSPTRLKPFAIQAFRQPQARPT